MANYSRGPRDELIRRLRSQGWSIRRIASHPDVQLSVGAVHAVVMADRVAQPVAEDDDDEWEPPVVDDEADRRYVAGLVDEAFHPDGTLNHASRLYRLLFEVREGYSIFVVRDRDDESGRC